MFRMGHLGIGDKMLSLCLKFFHFRLQFSNPGFSCPDGCLNLTDIFGIFQIELVIQLIKGLIFTVDT